MGDSMKHCSRAPARHSEAGGAEEGGDEGDLRTSWAWYAQHRKARGTNLREAALVSELLERSLTGY